jgi:hypothetical protein
MKILYVFILYVIYIPIFGCEISKQIQINSPNLNKDYVVRLEKSILASSKKYGLNPYLYSAILMQESSYRLNIVNKQDYGIAQINIVNIRGYKFNKCRLLTDLEYSVDSGARVLSWFKTRFQKKEPRIWWCRYNIGTGNLNNKKLKQLCLKYVKLVNRWR